MAVFKSTQKVVACTNTNNAYSAWRINYFNSRFRTRSIYLRHILILVSVIVISGNRFLPRIVRIITYTTMLKIKVKKKKKRIPIPRKPPKVESGKRTYNRKKEKNKLRKFTLE